MRIIQVIVFIFRVNSKDCEGAADEAGLVDLSGTDATHHKVSLSHQLLPSLTLFILIKL